MPVLAKDAVILFKKDDQWLPYQCASDAEISFQMETISVKTIGDGVWSKKRGQSKSYQINISGLLKFDDAVYPHAFDLYDYYDNMVDIEYRMVFTMQDGTTLRRIEGLALPTSVVMGGGSEGFAYGNVVLEGSGGAEIASAISSCTAEITAATLVLISGENALRVTALNGGPVTRYEYAFDGDLENRTTAFVDGTLPDDILFGNAPGGGVGDHTLTVWPICEDGNDGEPFEIEFTNLP